MAARNDMGVVTVWRFDNSYARLPEVLYSRVKPMAVERPALAVFNEELAKDLGLDAERLMGGEGAEIFAGNVIPAGAEPIAQAYAGHQFGHFTNLGDGRAVLLGEILSKEGERWDLQLKGSGQTPYSRRGDGRAALGPMLREYIISEAMQALGIPTTRSLAVATTGEEIAREEMLPGAVLTRMAASHIRVGTFEYAHAIGDRAALEALMQHTLERHYPEEMSADNAALALFEGVMRRQAELIARWMCVGFVHGVMNTDNMALSGETIDYGPCAFMDIYDPETVFSSIDRHGRYAYGNQPQIAQWNLARLAEALLPMIDKDRERAVELAEEALGKFPKMYRDNYLERMRLKLGLIKPEEGDAALIEQMLGAMQSARADFTMTFAKLTKRVEQGGSPHAETVVADGWDQSWHERLRRQDWPAAEVARVMQSVNPVAIPRNHRVEEALAAADAGNFTVMERLLEVLKNPFAETEKNEAYRHGQGPDAATYRTFCGT